MKKKIIIIIITILLILGGVGAFLLYRYNKFEYKKNITIKIGDKIPTTSDYTKYKASKIKWSKLKIEDKTTYYIGEYEGKINYHKKSYVVKLTVKDDKAPEIEVSDMETDFGKDIDILSNVKVKDNSKDEVKTEVSGEYDVNKSGEYNLKIVSTDKANNSSEKEFKLTVKNEVVVAPAPSQPASKNRVKTGTTSKGYAIENRDGLYYINGILIVNKSYDLPSNYNPGGLLSSFNSAFNTMKSAAANEGISLNIGSGFRSYSTQNSLYNRYASRDGYAAADTYSARPGHSEHQSGLAADIKGPNNYLYLNQEWINTSEGQWLNNNCYKYGFIIRYPKGKEGITGYIYEPWHIRYVGADVATQLYNGGNWITLEEYLGIDSKY